MDHLRLLILFGSRARGTHAVSSDADIGALGDRPLTLEDRAAAAEAAARITDVSENTIDLVDLWTASPLLQHQAAEEGKLIYGDPEAFLRFRVLAWKRYQDTAKFRRAREMALLDRS